MGRGRTGSHSDWSSTDQRWRRNNADTDHRRRFGDELADGNSERLRTRLWPVHPTRKQCRRCGGSCDERRPADGRRRTMWADCRASSRRLLAVRALPPTALLWQLRAVLTDAQMAGRDLINLGRRLAPRRPQKPAVPRSGRGTHQMSFHLLAAGASVATRGRFVCIVVCFHPGAGL